MTMPLLGQAVLAATVRPSWTAIVGCSAIALSARKAEAHVSADGVLMQLGVACNPLLQHEAAWPHSSFLLMA